jgi:hypothetical protein
VGSSPAAQANYKNRTKRKSGVQNDCEKQKKQAENGSKLKK